LLELMDGGLCVSRIERNVKARGLWA